MNCSAISQQYFQEFLEICFLSCDTKKNIWLGKGFLLAFNIKLQVVAQKTSRYELMAQPSWEISVLITPPPLEIYINFKFPAVLKFSR